MTDAIFTLAQTVNSYLWGPPMLLLLVATGGYLTWLLRGLQFRQLVPAFKNLVRPTAGHGDINHFKALMTALAATVGTGNIVGVATAITLGGPGALLWMWLIGLLGMATKYAEALLGVYFRQTTPNGAIVGGPMFYVAAACRWRWPAQLVAICLVLAAFGGGILVQANAVSETLNHSFNLNPHWSGLGMACLTGLVLLGGITRLGTVAAALVPAMIFLYIGAGFAALVVLSPYLPDALALIYHSAFTGTAALGGFAGATLKEAIVAGVSRGVFSNESGLGSAGFAAAAAKTRHPAEQALVSMTQTFIDTIIVCSITGLVIVTSGLWQTTAGGAALTASAFNLALPGSLGGVPLGSWVVTLSLLLFTYTTIIGWSYYGERSWLFLAPRSRLLVFKTLAVVMVYLGAVVPLATAWEIATLVFGLVIAPNLLAVLKLSPLVKALTTDYLRQQRQGGAYQLAPFAASAQQRKRSPNRT